MKANNPQIKDSWDKQAQLQKNQPLMELIARWRQQNSDRPPTDEEIREYQDIQESLKRNRMGK